MLNIDNLSKQTLKGFKKIFNLLHGKRQAKTNKPCVKRKKCLFENHELGLITSRAVE